MQAAVVPAVNSSWQVKDVPQPQPGPNQVLVKMHASGICYTDVHQTLGHFPGPFPRILGHEPVGEIVAVAPDHHAKDRRSCGYRLDSIHLRALRMVPAWPQNVLRLSEGYSG
jgi:D-arabinose 1-dehydrogenase-like Zn-dependent alcohol dehydrogenase